MTVFPELNDRGYTEEEYDTWMQNLMKRTEAKWAPGKGEQVYQAVKFFYTAYPNTNDTEAIRQRINDVSGQ